MQVVKSAEQTTTELSCLSVKKVNIEHKVQLGPPHGISRGEDLVKENGAEVEILESVDSVSCSEIHYHLRNDGNMSCSIKKEYSENEQHDSGGISVELQSEMDRLEVEQKRWKEQLAKEQREREVYHCFVSVAFA